MLELESAGSWRQIGMHLGRTFGQQLHACVEHYAPWLKAEPARYAPALAELRQQLNTLAPELLEESEGLAQAADLDPQVVLGYRFFNAVKARMSRGCSSIYLADTPQGPLLGRNCDLIPGFDPQVQLRRLVRPQGQTPLIFFSYLGVAGSSGGNAHGLALGGSSAHTRQTFGDTGLPNGLWNHLLLARCRDLADLRTLCLRYRFRGKPCNMLLGDQAGNSAALELAPGAAPIVCPRAPHARWQCRTNFFASGKLTLQPEVDYLQSAYARFGRVAHVLDSDPAAHRVDGLKQLLREIAQPGMVDTGRNGAALTVFSTIHELRTGLIHYTPGHPADGAWTTCSLQS